MAECGLDRDCVSERLDEVAVLQDQDDEVLAIEDKLTSLSLETSRHSQAAQAHSIGIGESDPCPPYLDSTSDRARGDALLTPLSFPERADHPSACFFRAESDIPIQCLVCPAVFSFEQAGSSPQEHRSPSRVHLMSNKSQATTSKAAPPPPECSNGVVVENPSPGPPKLKLSPKEEWLRHLLLEHKIVIHDVQQICSLKCYSAYWRFRLSQAPIAELAPVIRTNTDSDFPSEDYYLLSEALPEEKSLRQHLHTRRLEAVLEVQHRERVDTSFCRRCLFCSQIFSGNRRNLFQHMLDGHGFNVGQPDNLVFVAEFLDSLQEKLDSLQCLFCERTFRDRATLKDHMRKKGHKKISSQNKSYDKFYVINYLEPGKCWREVQDEEDRGVVDDSDWTEPPVSLSESVYCLFCLTPWTHADAALAHMRDSHGFDLGEVFAELDYYTRVKAVNYIRRQVHVNSCVWCSQKYTSPAQLLDHMSSSCHFKLPSNRATWDQPQYLFPTYENDSLLYGLDDNS